MNIAFSGKNARFYKEEPVMSGEQREPITSLEGLRRYAEAGGLDGPVSEKKRGKRSKYVKLADENGTYAVIPRAALWNRRKLVALDEWLVWATSILGGTLCGYGLIFWFGMRPI